MFLPETITRVDKFNESMRIVDSQITMYDSFNDILANVLTGASITPPYNRN